VGRNGVLFISDILSVRPSARWLERRKPFTDIAELRGTYWLTMENIPHLVSIRGNKSTAHDRKDAVPSEELITLLADREGNLWIGTLGSGAMKLLGEHLLVYNTASGLPTRNITTVFEDSQGRVWFGSSEGVSLLTGGRLLPNIRPLRRDANGEVVNTEYRAARAFAEDESGTLFIGTFMRAIGPASAEDYRSASPVRSMPIPWGVSAISIQHTGGDKAVWVATYGDGVYRLRKRDTTRFYQRDGLVSDMIEAIVPGKDAVWFLSRNHGASRWNNHRFETFSARSHGLPSDAIYSLAEEAPDRIWFGTDRGLVLYHRGRIRTWDQGDGLNGTYVLGIIPHRDTSMPDSGDGSLWIITDKMIHRLRQDVIKRFGSNPLLHTDDASINQVYHVRGTSRVWIATTLGALRLDLSALRRTRTPPMTVITEILADTVHITPSTVTMPEGKFPHGVNDLTVRFAGLSFSHEPSVRYQYRLEAKEQLWSAPTAESMVRYRQLPPGSYTLAVRAINPGGIPSTQPARFSFEILPPFYATWWFQAVLGLVILGALGGTIRYVELRRYQRELARLEREHAVNAERERTRARIARDLHDDLSSTLGSIALYAESLKRTLRAPTAETRLLLEKIATLAGGAIDAMGDIVWSVAPQHDTLSSVLGRIQHVTAELCALNQIAYTIRLPAVDDDIQLPDQVRRNLYLIVKEALTNSIKHAHAAEISIRGRLEHGVFELVVADTGVGLRAARRTKHSRTTLPSTGHGLQNMKSRAEEIGAELVIRSGSRKGTEICLRVRLGNGPRRENEA
jgi:signal transduction histidine kinase